MTIDPFKCYTFGPLKTIRGVAQLLSVLEKTETPDVFMKKERGRVLFCKNLEADLDWQNI